MSIKYDLYTIENPKTGTSNCYAKAVFGQTVSSKQLEKEIQTRTSLTTSDVKATLDAISSLIKEHLKEGKSVHLKGLGYMKVSLECTRKMNREESNGRHIKVRGVTFRAEKDLINDIRDSTIEHAKGHRQSAVLSEEQTMDLLRKHFETNHFLRRSEWEHIANVTREKACATLRKLTQDGILVKDGPRNAPIYLLAKEL